MQTLRALAPWTLFAALVLASCKGTQASDPEAQHEQQRAPAPASADVLALLGGLKAGEKLGPAEVLTISPVVGGTVTIELAAGGDRGSIFFVKVGQGPLPPASSEKYAVYYRDGKSSRSIASDALMAACSALADRLRKNELNYPAPAGLTAFAPDTPGSSSSLPL